MQLSRRSFGQKLAFAGIAISGSSLLTACPPFSSVYQKILQYVNVGLQAFQSVVNLLVASGVINVAEGTAISAAVNLVKVAFADLQTAVNNYLNSTGDKSTLIGKISVALAAVQASIQQFWNDLNIPDARLSSLVEGLLGVILSVLAGFQTQLPAPPPTAVKAVTGGKMIRVAAKRESVKDLKKEFNDILKQNGKSEFAI